MTIQTYCELNNIPEIHKIEKGMDLHNPALRKELFFKFYEFHTSYKIHPGLVYLFLPALAEHEGWNMEQRLWVAFIEGFCENPCTVWAITRFFPELPRTESELSDFEKWHSEHWKQLDYDTDTRYNKGHAVEQIRSYLDNLAGRSQEDFFLSFKTDNKKEWFDNIWEAVLKFNRFGRLTSWSYIEFIKILTGWDYEYSSLKMNELDGSKSHRNGLLRVLGRDDLEWWRGNDNDVTTHTKELMDECEVLGQSLTEELKERFKGKNWSKFIGYETVESALCAFKNCFHGRRYPNVYTDMSYERIRKAERFWDKDVDFSIFWKIREDNLPEKLLLEKNPRDPGFCELKRNWFRKTGDLPMISVMDDCFSGAWDKKYYSNDNLF